MRKLLHASFAVCAIAALLTMTGPGRALAQNTACYLAQGGATIGIGSGCTATVASGGYLNIASGGAFQIAGTQVTATAAQLNELHTAGVVSLDGSNPTSVTMSPLTTINGCAVSLVGSAIAGSGLDPVVLTVITNATAGRLDIYAWKMTNSSTDSTLVASTNSTTQVDYSCHGV